MKIITGQKFWKNNTGPKLFLALLLGFCFGFVMPTFVFVTTSAGEQRSEQNIRMIFLEYLKYKKQHPDWSKLEGFSREANAKRPEPNLRPRIAPRCVFNYLSIFI